MAATVSAWSKPGAWALDSEEHEEELLQQHQEEAAKANNRFKAAGDKPALSDFPSLSVASTTKTKKKKGQTLSLSEFTSYGSAKPAYTAQPKGLTNEDLMKLPTGPRERTAEELDRSRLGGGFRSYGSNDRSDSSKWGSSRGSDEPRKQLGFGKDSEREFAHSRADEVDDWGAGKKSGFGGGFERRERGERGERGGFFDSQSRADESDSWVSNKSSFVPSEGRRFGSTGGGGFERRGGFPSNGGGADSDNWGKKKEEEGRSFGANGGGGAFDGPRERRGGYELGTNGVDSDSWGKKREEGSVNGGGGGGGRPKLNLQPRRVPVGENLPSDAVTVKPKGSNPFGDARPREEVLKEKGQDWKEVDEKLESSKMKELASPAGSMDGASFGKRSFGSGNGRGSLPEDRFERSWRKADTVVDARPPSAEKTENGHAEEAEDNESQM